MPVYGYNDKPLRIILALRSFKRNEHSSSMLTVGSSQAHDMSSHPILVPGMCLYLWVLIPIIKWLVTPDICAIIAPVELSFQAGHYFSLQSSYLG